MKYMYLVYTEFSDKTQNWGIDDYKKWVEDHRALCKKDGVKLVWDGIAYTTVESYALFYETDMPLDDFHKFKAKVFALHGGGIMKYGITHMFLTWPWNL